MKSEKLHAKEAPKARIIILPVLMAVIILSAVFASDMPLWACILLGMPVGTCHWIHLADLPEGT